MKYPVILFDLDSTLLDTEKNADKALRKMPIASEFDFNDEHIAYWHQLNNHMWQQYENNAITRDVLLGTRFDNYFNHFGLNVDTTDFQDEYISLLSDEHELMPHTMELLDYLQDMSHRMFVISNGTRFKQFKQLDGANLTPYFEKIILSEDIGYKKPDVKFFETTEEKIADADKEDMLVVGDSLTADIAGAVNSDIDSVWYNPNSVDNKFNFAPTYETDDLLKIAEILK